MEEVKTEQVSATDVEKIYSFLAYVFFFSILIYRAKKESDFVQHHSRQGMILFFLTIANFIFMAIPFLGWVLIPFLNIAIIILFVIGANNALAGNMNKLPLIGQFSNIIK